MKNYTIKICIPPKQNVKTAVWKYLEIKFVLPLKLACICMSKKVVEKILAYSKAVVLPVSLGFVMTIKHVRLKYWCWPYSGLLFDYNVTKIFSTGTERLNPYSINKFTLAKDVQIIAYILAVDLKRDITGIIYMLHFLGMKSVYLRVSIHKFYL